MCKGPRSIPEISVAMRVPRSTIARKASSATPLTAEAASLLRDLRSLRNRAMHPGLEERHPTANESPRAAIVEAWVLVGSKNLHPTGLVFMNVPPGFATDT